MNNLDLHKCPFCVTELQREIAEDYKTDVLNVQCSECGEFKMTRDFYEDHVEGIANETNRKKLSVITKEH